MGALLTPQEGGFSFDLQTEISTRINILLRNLAAQEKSEQENDNFNTEEKTDTKYNLPETKNVEEGEVIVDKINTELENKTENAKLFDSYVKPTLQTTAEIENETAKEKEDNEQLEKAINAVQDSANAIKKEEKIENVTDDIVNGDVGGVEPKLEDVFIDDNEIFESDYMTEDDKNFVRSLIDKTIFFPAKEAIVVSDNDDDIDFIVDEPEEFNRDEVEHVKTVPPHSGKKPVHPRECLKTRVKQIRKKEEVYRKRAKHRAISHLKKKRGRAILNQHKKNLRGNDDVVYVKTVPPPLPAESEEVDITKVKTVPPPSRKKPIHPRLRLKEKVKKIRQ